MRIPRRLWDNLTPLDKKFSISILKIQLFRHFVMMENERIRAIKTAGIHLAATLAILALLPSPPDLPFIAIPITWGASLSTALILRYFLA